MSKKYIITTQFLEERGACRTSIASFYDVFQGSAELNGANLLKASDSRIDWHWLFNTDNHMLALGFTGVLNLPNKDILWYQDGILHRTDGPALTRANGETQYWVNGKLHREDGPAVTRASGEALYWVNGKLHREDGPAAIYVNGDVEYWVNNKRHRTDGPAVICANGLKEYWVNGERCSESEILLKNDSFSI